jgi:Toastrack DUF4097
MRKKSRYRALMVSLVLLSLATTSAWAEFDEDYTFDSKRLQIYNLIGEVHVEAAAGSAFEVELHALGDDADRDALDIETDDGSKARLLVGFPLDDEREYVYPRWNKRSSTSFTMSRDHEDGWLRKLFGRDRIKVRGKGNRGMELYVDLTIRVPEGAKLEVFHGAGEIVATQIEGDLVLDSHVGAIRVEDIEGDLLADTGSGSIQVSGVRGDVNADTGSGSIELVGIDGRTVIADTGSGGISLEDITADKVSADTGSGGVEINGVRTDLLLVDTGSGSVEALDVATNSMVVDTGSGSVEVELVEAGDGKYRIDTGSGSIRLDVPTDFSARVSAETSSGGVTVSLDDIDVHHRERNEMEFTCGGGAADVELDAGSGSIRVASR